MATSRRVQVVLDDLTEHTEKIMRRLQIRAFQALISRSPVQTGFFRAGWTPSVGLAPPGGPVDRPASKTDATSKAATLFAQRMQAAREIAASYKLSSGLIFIVNDVRYGISLNEGSSAQAPAMFVELAVQEAVAATAREGF